MIFREPCGILLLRNNKYLAGSFEFDSGRITESSTLDANGNVTSRLKGISFNYVQTKNNTTTSVSLSAEPDIGQTSAKDTVGTKYVDLLCTTVINRPIPCHGRKMEFSTC